jgi:hypothetical protein
MPSIKQLQARLDSANRLLAKSDLPKGERWRIAKLKLSDQARITLRQKFPHLDVEDPPKAEPSARPEKPLAARLGPEPKPEKDSGPRT